MRNTIRCLLAATVLSCGLNATAVWAAEGESAQMHAPATQEWEMLQGESLRSLAALFYPKNRYMQQRFVAATQALNREQLGAIAADQPFEQATALRIPDLHALSAQARPRAAKVKRKMAAMPRPQAAAAQPAAEMTGATLNAADVEAVAKRNQQRKAKLEDLQRRMQSLEDQSRAMQQDLGKNMPAEAAATEQPAPKPRKRVVAQ